MRDCDDLILMGNEIMMYILIHYLVWFWGWGVYVIAFTFNQSLCNIIILLFLHSYSLLTPCHHHLSTQVTEVGYQPLDLLQEHGVAANDIQKLNDAGFHTMESIAHSTVRKLSEVRGLSEAKVIKLKDIVKQLVPMEFKTAADALEDRRALVCLTTGSTELDKLLEGGVETGSLTEVFGGK